MACMSSLFVNKVKNINQRFRILIGQLSCIDHVTFFVKIRQFSCGNQPTYEKQTSDLLLEIT